MREIFKFVRHLMLALVAVLPIAVMTAPNLSSAQSAGSIKEMSRRTVVMPKQVNCAASDTCDLISARIVEMKLKVLLPDEQAQYASYMTDTRIVLDFSTPKAIEKYGVVQFMKGCMFESSLTRDGTVNYSFTHAHKNFGQYRPIKYQTPVVDSDQDDPLLSAYDGHGRFDLYRWNKNRSDLDAENAEWYFFSPPPHGTVFYADLVANTGLQEGTALPSARNSSVDFEVCLFKIADLPETSDPKGTGIDKNRALWCATWDHKFVYDFTKGRVVPETTISPICSM